MMQHQKDFLAKLHEFKLATIELNSAMWSMPTEVTRLVNRNSPMPVPLSEFTEAVIAWANDTDTELRKEFSDR